MADGDRRGKHRRRLFAVLGATFVWAALLCGWFFGWWRVSEVLRLPPAHPRMVTALALVFFVLFWAWFWRRGRGARLSKAWLVLRISSDALLIALLGGLLLWRWPSAALVVVGFALAGSYAARFVVAVVKLAARRKVSPRS